MERQLQLHLENETETEALREAGPEELLKLMAQMMLAIITLERGAGDDRASS